ncbi:MAG: ABC transporter ATP-binding protein [Desulfitobacteriaceae bacterium]
MAKRVLEVENLHTSFFTHLGEVKAVAGVSFEVEQGEVVAIVGESGSGKSVTSLSVMRLIQEPGKIIQGSIRFEGKDLVKLPEKQMEKIRGNKISMIFQDPMTSLNPVMKVGAQITEALRRHQGMTIVQARQRTLEMLRLVGLPSPEQRFSQYPHEFSGGMRQRVMIAMALACNPKLLIADEPTTALDVTIQAQIMELLHELKEKMGTAIILITHDLGVVAGMADKVFVMYGGKIVECGSVEDVYYHSQHPYTWGLLKSVPRLDLEEKQRLVPIDGQPPDLLAPPVGCAFIARCSYAMEVCQQMPDFFDVNQNHFSRCWLLHADAPKVERGRA